MIGHNDARWLDVRWLPKMGGRLPGGRHWRPTEAGWYVVRTCRCHKDQPVTIPLPSEDHARTAMWAMLEVSRRLGT
jgi:hypothetical protein